MKLRRLRVDVNFLISCCQATGLLSRRFRVVENEIPADARVIRVGYDDGGWLNLIIESESFDDVEDGPIPEHPATRFETVTE